MDEKAFIQRFRVGAPSARKAAHPGAYPAPAYEPTWERFARVLAAVGGRFAGPLPRAALAAKTTEVITEIGGRCVASAAAAPLLVGVTGFGEAPRAAAEPHGLADVELGILTAELAVAENAALLVSARNLPERALAFLPQHLLILVPGAVLLPDLITAQARLPTAPPHHLTWISGPSKTADIEQTLVIGAHGARSLTVVAYTA
jgi:L-lactate dehydrogenase complex protein LldG